jgi:hypothetical protein
MLPPNASTSRVDRPRGDANARVADEKLKQRPAAHSGLASRLDADEHFAIRREFHGIPNQIHQHLA